MKKLFSKLSILIALGSTSSFAIFGIGAHYAPNYGSKVKAAEEQIFFQAVDINNDEIPDDTISANLSRGKSKDFQGFGFKFWIDALPVIDIEATVNFQANTYSADLAYDLIGDDTGVQEIALRTPGAGALPIKQKKIDPAYGWVFVDLSANYPFFEVPLPVIEWKFYAGGGITYVWGTPAVSKSFAEKVVASSMEAAVAQLEGGNGSVPSPDDLSKSLIDAFKDEGYHSGVGGHVMIGTRLDLLVVSIYCNGKYHFGGLPDEAESGITMELGAGLGI